MNALFHRFTRAWWMLCFYPTLPPRRQKKKTNDEIVDRCRRPVKLYIVRPGKCKKSHTRIHISKPKTQSRTVVWWYTYYSCIEYLYVWVVYSLQRIMVIMRSPIQRATKWNAIVADVLHVPCTRNRKWNSIVRWSLLAAAERRWRVGRAISTCNRRRDDSDGCDTKHAHCTAGLASVFWLLVVDRCHRDCITQKCVSALRASHTNIILWRRCRQKVQTRTTVCKCTSRGEWVGLCNCTRKQKCTWCARWKWECIGFRYVGLFRTTYEEDIMMIFTITIITMIMDGDQQHKSFNVTWRMTH